MNFVKKNLTGYRRGSELFGEYSINSEHAGGLAEAYEYTAPVINVDRAMSFLTNLVKSKGAVLKTVTIKGDLLDQESKLLKEYKVDAIVNAMGLGAGEVAADPNVYGLHGALLRLVNDGKDFPIVRNAIIVSSTKVGESGGDGAFILPREDGILALGTISEAKGEATDLTLDSDAIKEMRARCEDLLPQLKNARLGPNYPLIRGTRHRGGVAPVSSVRRGALSLASFTLTATAAQDGALRWEARGTPLGLWTKSSRKLFIPSSRVLWRRCGMKRRCSRASRPPP